MTIRFRCKCGKAFKVADDFAGKRAKCPKCGVVLVVPKKKPPAPVQPELKPIAPPVPPPTPAPEQGVSADDLELEIEAPAAPGAGGDAVVEKPAAAEPGMLGEELELAVEAPPPSMDAQTDFGLAAKAPEAPLKEPPLGEGVVLEAGPPAAVAAPATDEELPVPETGEAAVSGDNRCPKCGASLEEDALICTECGTSVTTAPAEAAPAPVAEAGTKGWLVFLLIPLGLVVIIGAVTGLAMLARGSRKPSAPVQPTATAPAGRAEPSAAPAGTEPTPAAPSAQPRPGPGPAPAGPPTAPAPTPRRAAAPPPQPAPKPRAAPVGWPGFSDASLAVRDCLLDIGRKLAVFQEKNRRPAASLAEAGVVAEDAAAFTFVPPDANAPNRFRPVAYQAAANASGCVFVLFSDGSVRDLSADELAAALPQQTPDGRLTAADAALLDKLTPLLRVTNHRFRILDVTVDGNAVGQVEKGATRTFRLTPPGTHSLLFRAGDKQTKPIQATFAAGLVYDCAFPPYQDLPLIPLRVYYNAFKKKDSPYELVKGKDQRNIGLKSSHEVISFTNAKGQAAIPKGFRLLRGVIERGGVKIEGRRNKSIRVSRLGCLEEGIVRYPHGDIETYQRTALDTLRVRERANAQIAPLALLPELAPKPKEEDAAQQPGSPWGDRARTGRAKTTETEAPRKPKAELTFPPLRHRTVPDTAALGQALKTATSSVVPLLLNQVRKVETESVAAAGRAAIPRASQGGSPHRPSPWGAARQASAARPAGRAQAKPPTWITFGILGREAAQKASPEKPLAMLALYGDASAVKPLSALCNKRDPDTVGYPELLLALARCGQGTTLLQLQKSASRKAAAAGIALSLVDSPAARTGLGTVMAQWTDEELADAARAWPDIAGPNSRRVFVSTFAKTHPNKLDDPAILNALLQIQPHALVRVLAEQVAGRSEVQRRPATQPSAPAGPPRPPDPARPSRRPGPPVDPQPAGSVRPPAPLGHPGAAPPGSARPGAPPSPPRHQAPRPVPRVGIAAAAVQPNAWRVLGHFRHTASVKYFCRLLAHGGAAEKEAALLAIGETRDPAFIPSIVPLLADRSPEVRKAGVTAALRIGDAAAVRALEQGMTSGLLFLAIPEAAPALAAKVGAPATSDLLAGMLTLALAEPKKAEAAKPKEDKRAKGGKRNVFAAWSRASGKDAESDEPPKRQDATPEDILAALTALGTPTEAAQAAVAKARGHADPKVRAAACGASSKKDRLAALKDSAPDVRATGVRLLGAMPAATSMPLLAEAAGDKSPVVRAAAMQMIEGFAGENAQAVELLAGGLADSDVTVVTAAAKAAAAVRHATLGPPLVEALSRPAGTDAAALDRAQALIQAAVALREPRACQALGLLLTHPEAPVRAAAAYALGVIGNPETIPTLLSATEDGDDKVSAAVFTALCKFATAETVQTTLALSAGESDALSATLRLLPLQRLAAGCAKPGPYADWLQQEQNVFDGDRLADMVKVAATAPAAWHPGLAVIGKRHLSVCKGDARIRAAEVLSYVPEDESVHAVLFQALAEDPEDLPKPVADLFRRTRSPGLLSGLWARYKKLDKALRDAAKKEEEEQKQQKQQGGGSGSRSGTWGGRTSRPVVQRQRQQKAEGEEKPTGLAAIAEQDQVLLRCAIVEGIGATGGDDAARLLGQIAVREKRDPVLEKVVEALVASKSPRAVAILGKMATPKRVGTLPVAVRAKATRALARIATLKPDTAQRLLTRLKRNYKPTIASAAADGLAELNARKPKAPAPPGAAL